MGISVVLLSFENGSGRAFYFLQCQRARSQDSIGYVFRVAFSFSVFCMPHISASDQHCISLKMSRTIFSASSHSTSISFVQQWILIEFLGVSSMLHLPKLFPFFWNSSSALSHISL
jgi:hypothetical protein